MTVTFSTYVYYVHHTLKMYILIRWSQTLHEYTYFKNSLSHLVCIFHFTIFLEI